MNFSKFKNIHYGDKYFFLIHQYFIHPSSGKVSDILNNTKEIRTLKLKSFKEFKFSILITL